ncbi:MAG TPA: hypothetical protein VFQ61_07795 [Polyangiaceae bacterium]|nr:hypothetical protein [Polyangiaceae bacterium]
MSRSTLAPRTLRLISTARQNPEFAARLASELPEPSRRLLMTELARPEPARAPGAKGLAKCKPSPYAPENGLTAQLSLFAQRASRVR